MTGVEFSNLSSDMSCKVGGLNKAASEGDGWKMIKRKERERNETNQDFEMKTKIIVT